MEFKFLLEELLAGTNLADEKIRWLILETMNGRLTGAQIAAWLIALRQKGETPNEIATCARVMREMATPIKSDELPTLFIDTCGTGGDRSHLINISTLVGLTLASLGIPVAKHGNRAVSSSSGSADVLEAIGYPLEEKPELITARLVKNNFAFFFAPLYHPAMKHAGPVRKDLGVRTIFNILGPLANPAGAPVQLLGVYDKKLVLPMAETLKILGTKAALVVHSDDGLDEISPVADTHYALLSGGKINAGTMKKPEQDVVQSLDELRADTKEASLAAFNAVCEGKHKTGVYMTALNAATAKKLFDATKKDEPITDPAPSSAEINLIVSHIASAKIAANKF